MLNLDNIGKAYEKIKISRNKIITVGINKNKKLLFIKHNFISSSRMKVVKRNKIHNFIEEKKLSL
ncbi:hypothetical protein CFB3_30720 [Clostridium folliculivorans]|uniref:Uncharacterized protein n=1 Tax=Clostridium folliculivorans TaxID=2886038 RepID=A0A9W5Y1N9_9CLOT|nr:hypothetical protein CFOLD11_16930 [Clostridium folliculivorans]GKU30965.1 hypothetical protein CFB3_30720 [Clostridium folliculivorans]